MTDPAHQRLDAPGGWTLWLAPDAPADVWRPLAPRLGDLLAAHGTLLCPPGRHRLDRIVLSPDDLPGGGPHDLVVKTYGPVPAWRDATARRLGIAGKAVRAFLNARRLQDAAVGTPAPLAALERRDPRTGRLLESRLVTAYEPGLTDFRAELERIYAEAPLCAPLMDLLEAVATAVRAFHDAGLVHRDLGNQNIPLRRDPAAPHGWRVLFLDLNRARACDPAPTDAQRGADLARLDLPSDFRRVFLAMYNRGYTPSKTLLRAEAKTRAAFARHTALRPYRHPIREARIRRAEAAARARGEAPPRTRGRDLWIWDDRSSQPIPAYTSRDRHRYLSNANVTCALAGALRRGLFLRREYHRLLAESFHTPVPFAGAIGVTLDPDPATWSPQLAELDGLRPPGAAPLPVLLRLHHHLGPDHWNWTLDRAGELRRAGHPITLALLQSRRAITAPGTWRALVELAYSRASDWADAIEIGHAVNRCKWGLWDPREIETLLAPVRDILAAARPRAATIGPACIDFEPHALLAFLHAIKKPLPFAALSHHLYVDRRGPPEAFQGRFDLVAKCALLRAAARVHGFPTDRIAITETNWPLLGTGPWSPVTSPYETLDPRRNDPSVTEENYAACMARYLLLALASGHVTRVHWFRLAARGFGLVDDTDPGARRLRPAYHALRTLLANLSSATYDGTGLQTTPDGTRTLRFTRPSASPITVRWTLDTLPTYTPE